MLKCLQPYSELASSLLFKHCNSNGHQANFLCDIPFSQVAFFMFLIFGITTSNLASEPLNFAAHFALSMEFCRLNPRH